MKNMVGENPLNRSTEHLIFQMMIQSIPFNKYLEKEGMKDNRYSRYCLQLLREVYLQS